MELPVGARTAMPPVAPAEAAGVPPRPSVILIVDDEPSITKALAQLLRRDGHSVDTAANGRLALRQLEERAYDLILCDLRMPELDGPGLYRALESRYPPLCRRFIFLTGDTLNPETQPVGLHHGVPYLVKPYTAAALRRVIQQVLHTD